MQSIGNRKGHSLTHSLTSYHCLLWYPPDLATIAVMSLPIRSLRSAGISRRSLAALSSAKVATPAARALAPSSTLPAFTQPSSILSPARLFSSTPATFRASKDKSWVQQGEVPYPELKSHTETPDESLLLLDVREPSETAQGMIPSAVNVPLSEFGPAFLNKEGGGDFEKKYAFARPEFDKKIVVYCRSGKRSEQARTELEKAGWWK